MSEKSAATQNLSNEVRVRIAPSPTGDPHVGTAYVALFNYLFAKQSQGKFIIRIEDTDQQRSIASSEESIYRSLEWLGLKADEGPIHGGDYGPYRQSERTAIYKEHVEQLIQGGHAYYDFDTPEQSKELRAEARKRGENKFFPLSRDFDNTKVGELLANDTPYVIRLKVAKSGSIDFTDSIRGAVSIDNLQTDDQILLKSDGFPTYHLASVVDDHLMKITHVIRAEEWISSTPKHVLLYKCLGWQEPVWVHLPLLRNNDKSKISKRKNPTSIEYYQRAGILPAALINFIALMGWSHKNEDEVFDLDFMYANFKLSDLRAGGPIFDQKKLLWLNQQYVKKLNCEDFIQQVQSTCNADYLSKIYDLVCERIESFDQFFEKNIFFFNGKQNLNNVDLPAKNTTKQDSVRMFKNLALMLDELYDWNADTIQEILNKQREEIGWKPKTYFMSVRLAVTGRKDSPPLAQTLAVIGREMVRFRLRDAAIQIQAMK